MKKETRVRQEQSKSAVKNQPETATVAGKGGDRQAALRNAELNIVSAVMQCLTLAQTSAERDRATELLGAVTSIIAQPEETEGSRTAAGPKCPALLALESPIDRACHLLLYLAEEYPRLVAGSDSSSEAMKRGAHGLAEMAFVQADAMAEHYDAALAEWRQQRVAGKGGAH